jgi:hypothetical protein
VVAVSHVFILAGVVTIANVFHGSVNPGDRHFLGAPTAFVIGEGVIIALCAASFFSVRLSPPAGFTSFFEPVRREVLDLIRPTVKVIAELLPRLSARYATPQERAKGALLLGAFVVQFAALYFLLEESGGPVESPFVGLILAFAIFTPYVATEKGTIFGVLLLSLVYYGAVVCVSDAAAVEAGDGAYFLVNALFVSVGVFIAYVDRSNQARERIEQAAGVLAASLESPEEPRM